MPTIRSMHRIFLLGMLSFVFTSAASQAAEKHIYGLHEKVYLRELGVQLEAKLDTGATTTSLSAKVLEFIEKDGQQWVSFELAAAGQPAVRQELPVVRTSRIKRRADDADVQQNPGYSQRPVVLLSVAMGDQLVVTEANLTDRSHFDYPLLLGATTLEQFSALVDVANSYQAGEPAHKPGQAE